MRSPFSIEGQRSKVVACFLIWCASGPALAQETVADPEITLGMSKEAFLQKRAGALCKRLFGKDAALGSDGCLATSLLGETLYAFRGGRLETAITLFPEPRLAETLNTVDARLGKRALEIPLSGNRWPLFLWEVNASRMVMAGSWPEKKSWAIFDTMNPAQLPSSNTGK